MESESKTEQNQKNSSKPVFVKAQDTEASPHIVDLREDDPDLEDVGSFREKMNQARERKTVDFAEMVKQANEDSNHKEENIKIDHDNPASHQLSQETRELSQQKKAVNIKLGQASSDDSSGLQSIAAKLPSSQIKAAISGAVNAIAEGFFSTASEAGPGSVGSSLSGAVERQKEALKTFWADMTRRRAFATVLSLIAVLLLPFPVAGYYNKVKQDSRSIVEKSTHGFSALSNSSAALFSSNINQAKYNLASALTAFDEAQSMLNKDYKTAIEIASLIPIIGDDITARENLLSAGHHLALGNTYLVKGVSDAKNKTELPLTERLQIIENHLQSAIPQYEQALRSLAVVSKDEVPKKYAEVSQEFKVLFAAMIDDMQDLVSLIDTAQMIFGHQSYKKYLVVFQNSNELRPLGGFAGSYAVVEVQKGKVSWDIPSGGSYDLQGQMNLSLKPPVPLQMVNSKWEFQDANYFSHLPASAKVMEDMYTEARGSTVDGVITVNSDVLKRVLDVTGPINLSQFDEPITKENVLRKVQKSEEEVKKNTDKKPKAILSPIAERLMDKIKSGKNTDLLHLAVEAYQALNQKQIQVYMEDDQTQETLRSYGWTGEILPAAPKQDYLHLVHSNLQGQKSNAKIKENLELKTKIKSDGTVINKLIINRKHTADPDDPLYGSTNFSHVQAFVPQGSKLVAAEGFEFPPERAFRAPIDNAKTHPVLKKLAKNERYDSDTGTRISRQFGKTVFGHWIITKPGQSSKAYIKYKLPFKVKSKKELTSNLQRWKQAILSKDRQDAISYSMFLQKQSGTNYSFNHEVKLSSKWRPLWRSSEEVQFGDGKVMYKKPLTSDTKYGFLLESSN
ncbi:MAG: DUF4012 domain-containing protein [Candidatus Paceibacteria bacterium]